MMTKLKRLLMDREEYQYRVAERARLTETRLSRIARGRARATDDEQRRLAAALNVAKEELFGATDAPAQGVVQG